MKISVIIPCYNVEKYISKCLISVYNQAHRDIQIICINDGSTDATASILEDMKKISPFELLIFNQKNKGASTARNYGISKANGEYIQFLDADDTLNANKIKNQIALITSNNKPDLIIGSYRKVLETGKEVSVKTYKKEDASKTWRLLMESNLGITSSNLFKTSLFDSAIRWDDSLKSSQEYTLMFEILKLDTRIIFDEDLATNITIRDSGSISQTNIEHNWNRYLNLRIAIIQFLKAKKPEVLTSEIYQVLFDTIRMVYPYNAKLAVSTYSNFIPPSFSPSTSKVTNKRYLNIFKLMGLKKTEFIIRILKNLFK